MPVTSDLNSIAHTLHAARAGEVDLIRYPCDMPQTMTDAYAIQDMVIALDGRQVGGWKVGRIAPNLVGQYGDDRLAGPIFVDEIRDASSGQVPEMPIYVPGFAAAEAEVLLCLGDVGERDYDIDTVREVITDVRAGLEIASSPFGEINLHGPAVTASDNGNNKGLVLGPQIPDWRNADLIHMPVELAIDGRTLHRATMETMLDGPFGSALFLIRILRERGIAIPAGTWVSAGAITGIHEILPGQHADALFDDTIRVSCTVKRFEK